MEKKSLHISIPKPCSQNWDKMQPMQDGGRHCSYCNKIIYDFSQMSDGELLNFFKENKTVHCGRFHNTQLNRTIYSIQISQKLLFAKFNKIAAVVFAVLSFKSIAAHRNLYNNSYRTVLNASNNKKINSYNKFVISGTIKDKDGMPIVNASILFDSLNIAKSDKDGKFLFEVENISNVTHTIYFNYDDYTSVVRTYHPSMQSTNYDVILTKPSSEYWSMGIILPPWHMLDDLPSLVFKKKEVKISKENKELLNTIAEKLKANPETKIIINGYVPVCDRIRATPKRVENIRKYFINEKGISNERISTNIEVDGGDLNTIDIKVDLQ